MSPKPKISQDKLPIIEKLYLNEKLSIKDVSKKMGVSLDAIESFIKRNSIPKRSRKDAQKAKFFNKPLSFKKQELKTQYLKELASIGTMLYWAEGYKGQDSNSTVDFANSDPSMIKLFLIFVRSVFKPQESKFRVYLYCYSDQNIDTLISFWSKITKIPKEQFSKPYVRSDFKIEGRKMEYGMIHVRYHDKKLLLEIKSMIQSYISKYASVV